MSSFGPGPRSAPARSVRRMESVRNANSIVVGGRISLEGDELEDYCKKRGLCPLCAKTRTRRRVFHLFKKNKWELLTIQNEGKYTVYKGFCVRPECFSLEQAKRLAGESADPESAGGNRRRSSLQRRLSRMRSVMGGALGDDHSDHEKQFGHGDESRNLTGANKSFHKRKEAAFPPPELRNTNNFHGSETEPLFVIQKTVERLQQDSNSIIVLDLSGFALRRIDFEALAEGLKVNTTVTTLIMENTKLDNANIQILASGLEEGKDIPLNKIYIRNNTVGDGGIAALCHFLHSCDTLEKLDFSRNNISSEGALAVFSALHRNRTTRIRCINMSHNSLWDLESDDFGIKTFLRRNRTLRILNLEGNHLDDEGIESLTLGLQENDQTALERLYLGWNDIGDEGAIALAELLERNISLRVLGLGENRIQNSGARALLAAMDMNVTIKEISGLWRNKIDRRFIIVAIRRLLLSAERNDTVLAKLDDLAPDHNMGRMPSEDFDIIERVEVNTTISTLTNDPQYSDLTPQGAPSEDEMDDIYSKKERKWDRLIVPKQPSPKREEAPTRNSFSSSMVLRPSFKVDGLPYDRFTAFYAAPLTFFDRDAALHREIPLLDYEYECKVINESLRHLDGGKIDIDFEVATMERFSSFFARNEAYAMHFTCSGPPGQLPLENGYGSLQPLSFNRLKHLTSGVDSKLRIVFVSSRHAKEIAQAFLDAGVSHVISCQLDHQFRDGVGMLFVESFYRALSTKQTLAQAFNFARSTVTSSPTWKDVRRLSDRFQLLPYRPRGDPYHEVPFFFAEAASPKSPEDIDTLERLAHLPRPPRHFLGREVDMFEILEALRVDDIVRIAGPVGIGKDSVVSAVCHYALERRKTFSVDNIYWLPAPKGIVPEEDSLYGDLCLCANILKEANVDVWETDEILLECRDRIEIELENLQVVLVVDERCFPYKGAQDGLEKFVTYLLNVANAKVILLTSRSTDGISSMSHTSTTSRIEEANLDLGPLDFKATASLFGSTCKYITSSSCPAAHTASEFAQLLEPPFVSKRPDIATLVSQRRTDLFARMGNGLPSAVIAAATKMSKEDFIEFISIANRPEILVDSLGSLEREIQRRKNQREHAIGDQNYLRATDLDSILEELDTMRPEFPTIENLQQEEEVMKIDLQEAVENRQYDTANRLKRELIQLKKKIMKEQRLRPNANLDQDANEKLNEFQAHVEAMIEDSHMNGSSRKLGAHDRAVFAIDCDDRDCCFVVYAGSLADFENSQVERGIVVWTNECCDLQATASGKKLLEMGGTMLQKELFSLPVVEKTTYGEVRCSTGNAIIVGTRDFGNLPAPCMILSVGPMSPRSFEDAPIDNDTDSLFYITNMLRSCYRSSMVLAKHAALQALGLNLLTTRKSGKAYEQTVQVGLQTLAEEVKFSHLRDVHIIASTPAEAAVIVKLLDEMGHKKILDYPN